MIMNTHETHASKQATLDCCQEPFPIHCPELSHSRHRVDPIVHVFILIAQTFHIEDGFGNHQPFKHMYGTVAGFTLYHNEHIVLTSKLNTI